MYCPSLFLFHLQHANLIDAIQMGLPSLVTVCLHYIVAPTVLTPSLRVWIIPKGEKAFEVSP